MIPETFTDDIAPALPSSLNGPLQIVDPGNQNSWIKIDPASAIINMTGGARPKRKAIIPYSRVYATATATAIGVVLPAYYVTSITNGGFHGSPIPIPADMDLTEPASVYVLVASLTSSTQTGPVVRFVLSYTYGKASEVPTDGSITYDWTAPDNWTADELRSVLLDDGNGRTFAANTFEPGDELGLRVSRLGTATEDTFNKAVKFAARLVFEYTAKNL